MQLASVSSVGEKEWEVTSVRSKYVYALNETTRLIEGGVLSAPGIAVGRFTTPEELAKKERKQLRALLDAGRSIEELYELYALPVAALAQLTGRVVPDFWRAEGGYRLEAKGHFFAADGTEREIREHRQVAITATGLVLDWTALLTVVHLGIEELLAARFERVVVTRALRDEVAAYTRGSSSASVLREGSTEAAQRDLAGRLEKFVREKCDVVEVEEWNSTDDEISKTYGRSTIATFKVVVQEGLPLFSDDMRGRNLAHDRYGVPSSIGIQWILLNLRATKQLSNEAYFEAVLKLIHAGYGFIWVSIAFFLWIVRRDNHEVTDDVRAVLRTLSLWKTVDSLAVALSAGVLTALWKENLLEHRRQALVKAVLDALVEERDTFQVTQMLGEQLVETVGLQIHLLRLISADIAWWSRRRIQVVKNIGIIMPDTNPF